MRWNYIAKQSLSDFSESTFDENKIYDIYDRVIDIISSEVNEQTASFFARPEVLRGNGQSTTTVAWYSAQAGDARRWRDLDDTSRDFVADQVRLILAALRPLLTHPEIGDYLQRWLNLTNFQDNLYVVSNRPVIVNWGLVPTAAEEDRELRRAFFAENLGRFADWITFVPFLETEQLELKTALSGAGREQAPGPGAAAIAGAAAVSGAVSGAGPAPDDSAIPPDHTTRDQRSFSGVACWLPLAVLCGTSLLLLLVLLWPGVLIYPAAPQVAAGDLAGAEQVLRRRIADLQGTLSAGTCSLTDASTADLIRPVTADASPQVIRPQLRPFTPGQTAATQIPPSPRQVEVPPAVPGASPSTLIEKLDSAAVLVFSRKSNSVVTGSGFFVNASDIVTNRHVVEGTSSQFYVVNKALGVPMKVDVVSLTARKTETGSIDFAVLRLVDQPPEHEVLALGANVQRGANVLAYGYPSFVMETDATYRCLLAGNQDCVPVGSVTTGIVTALQTGGNGLPLALHTATISEGNSGGPLADYCGRVVGVNTFWRRNAKRLQQLNFAQRARALAGFLDANAVPFSAEDAACSLVREARAVADGANGQSPEAAE